MTDTGDALARGTRLDEFEVERVLGAGGFGITYLARDLSLDAWRAVKEYLPRDWGTRGWDGTIGPRTGGDAEDYRWGLERFLDEARMLARFRHPHIVQVYRVFEGRGTAYMVTEYVEGRTLAAEVAATGRLSEARAREVLSALADGLSAVHGAGLLHRDIKPQNVMVRPDGMPVLIDFGAARQAMGRHSRSVTAVLTPGYAPIEQYSARGHQGPWTDIYALGAVAYWALSGQVPEDATERVRTDSLPPLGEAAPGRVSRGLAAAVDAALAVNEADRPQSLEAWRALLEEGATGVGSSSERPGVRESPREVEVADGGSAAAVVGGGSARRWWLVGASAALLAGVVLVAVLGVPRNGPVAEEVGVAVTPSRVEEIVQPEALLPVDPSEEPEVPAPPPEAGPAPAAVEEALGLDRAARRLIQEGLLAAGFDPGAADGQFGAGTRAALREWQAAGQAAETGYLDAASALRLTAEGAEREAAQRQAELAAEAQRQAEREAARRQAELAAEAQRQAEREAAQRQAELAAEAQRQAEREAARRQAELAAEAQRQAEREAAQRQVELAAEAQRQAEREARRRPGDMFRDCAECPEMVVLPGGDLAMGRYEVTVGEYRAFASAAGRGAGGGCSWQNPGFPQTARHPVTCVNWDDAQGYVSWLSRRTGAAYRLPSEAEWTRAATGSQPGCDRLGRGTRPDGTCPVGSYGTNAAGLSDMVGNLWEWTSDCWEGNCSRRVVRGGSWVNIGEFLRPGARVRFPAAHWFNNRGFRISRTLD